jgi:hypothetical protein
MATRVPASSTIRNRAGEREFRATTGTGDDAAGVLQVSGVAQSQHR